MRRRTAAARALLALGVGLAVAVAVGAGRAWRAAAAHGWLDAGYHRLVLGELWARADALVPAAVAAAAVAAVWGALRPRPAPRGVALGVALALVVGLLRAGTVVERWRVAGGPNLLLVSIDTLRADRLGAYGYGLATSPTLDRRLAADGVLFEEVWSQSPKTTPSHMTMLTSLYPSVHGVEIWDGTAPARALNPAVHTLAEVLRNAGYATAAFTGGGHMGDVWGFAQGFDHYEACDGAELGRARRWLKHHAGEKLFLFFHTYQVHDPYLPPLAVVDRFDPEYRGPLRDTVRRLRNEVVEWEDQERAFWASVDRTDARALQFLERLYDAGIRHMDESTLAPLLDHLAALGLERDTLVVFTSDHGEAFLEHGRFLHDDLHAETLRVPLVLRFPGRLPAGRRVAEPVRLVDVMPTILDLLGVPAPPVLQGRSLGPLARGEAAPAAAPEAVSEYSSPRAARRLESVRRDGATLILDGPREALYLDPAERDDRTAARPDLVAALRARLARWRDACGPLAATLGAPETPVEPGEDIVRRLRALGYVQ